MCHTNTVSKFEYKKNDYFKFNKCFKILLSNTQASVFFLFSQFSSSVLNSQNCQMSHALFFLLKTRILTVKGLSNG